MVELLTKLNIWSSKKLLQTHVTQHPGVDIYHEKNSSVLESDQYIDIKRKYVEGQGRPWCLSNRRPDRFRDNLNELEELLENQFIAAVAWRNIRTVQLLLSNATLVTVGIALDSADIEKIFVDRSLVGKFPDFISDGAIQENFMALSFMEKSKLALINFSKKPWNEKKDIEKLSAYEPKVSMVDLPGPSSRRIKRKCLCNKNSDLICVWWSNSIEEAWPWSPLVSESDRANLVLLSITNISSVFTVEVLAFMRTDGDPVDACFSHRQPYQLLTLEQSQSSRAKHLLEVCIYDLYGEQITKVASMTIPLKARVICQSRNYQQDKVALMCCNHTLILWDEHQRKTKTTKINFLATCISWHPADSIFVITSNNGDIQAFDMALNCLFLQMVCEESTKVLKLSQYFFSIPKLRMISWAVDNGIAPPPDLIPCADNLVLVFDRGPVAVLRFELGVCSQGLLTPIQLTCEYIKADNMTEAVALLNSMNWNQAGAICFQCLCLITSHLLRQEFDAQRESNIEDTLGSFYAPVRPLQENIILQYRDDISRIARRFFHHLLRHKRFEKAFLLAVDLGCKDLFMDIHYLAQSVGNLDVASASRERAMQIHYRETNQDVGSIGSDDDRDLRPPAMQHQNQLEQLDQQIRRMNLSERPPVSQLSTSSSTKPPLRKSRSRKAAAKAVRYSFADSDDDDDDEIAGKTEDPIAWALASRSGHVLPARKDKHEESNDLHLVHFGNV